MVQELPARDVVVNIIRLKSVSIGRKAITAEEGKREM